MTRVPVAVVLLSSLLAGLAVACAGGSRPSAPPAEAGAAEACVVIAARNEPEGLAAERAWLHEKLPGWHAKTQSLGRDGDRVLDRLVVIDADGAEHRVCFDITAWFGKF